uniref:Ovule protein n=1 Tax=Heterorhabditis bacteriophora TaxID=37862 RepID=A0A1I7X9M6_HETBA
MSLLIRIKATDSNDNIFMTELMCRSKEPVKYNKCKGWVNIMGFTLLRIIPKARTQHCYMESLFHVFLYFSHIIVVDKKSRLVSRRKLQSSACLVCTWSPID